MYRKILLIVLCVLLSMKITACQMKEKVQEQVPIKKPVKVIILEEEVKEKSIRYTGNVNIKDTRNFAFKNPGKIASIPVKKGAWVQKGDVLASLDTTDLNFAVAASEGQLQAADSQYRKAQNGPTVEDIEQLKIHVRKAEDALRYTQEMYDKIKLLYESGAVAENELDKIDLEKDVRTNDLQQAKVALQTALNGTREEDLAMARAKVSIAQTDLAHKQSQIEDSTIISDMEGYVAEIIQKEGDFVSAGHPVIVLRGTAQIVKTGIARQDMDKVQLGSRVHILSGQERIEGRITYISDIPDPYTRTYEAEITPDTVGLSIGSIVELDIIIGSESGIWVPISAMMSEGKDFVFLAEEESLKQEEQSPTASEEDPLPAYRAVRRNITIDSTRGAYAKVEGLMAGEYLIVEGMRSVRENEVVQWMGEEP